MNNLSHRDKADDVLKALTHGDPEVNEYEIRESGVNPHGVAHAILIIDGHDYSVEVVALHDGE
jgi:hypothetical protein